MKRTRTLIAFTASLIAFAIGLSLTTATANASVKTSTPTLKLLWSQEFNNQKKLYPDSKVWNYDLGNNGGWGNNENEYYTSTNAITQGVCPTGYKVKTTDQRVCTKSGAKNVTATGALNIFAKKIPGDDIAAASCAACYYYSARINTKNKLSFKYGKIEARIWMPRGDGTWPAFWLLGRNIDQVQWPNSGEIDIVEGGKDPYSAIGTTHGPNRFGASGISGYYSHEKPLSAGWHKYALIWTPTYLEWTFDGTSYFKLTKSEMTGVQGETWTGVFDQPFFLIMNLAMGGWFVGGAPDLNITTASYKIDWVRYHSYNGYGTLYKR